LTVREIASLREFDKDDLTMSPNDEPFIRTWYHFPKAVFAFPRLPNPGASEAGGGKAGYGASGSRLPNSPSMEPFTRIPYETLIG